MKFLFQIFAISILPLLSICLSPILGTKIETTRVNYDLVSVKPCPDPPGPLGNEIGRTFANKGKRYELVKKLVEEGADVNESYCGGKSPLITSAKVSYPADELIVEFLLANGADVNRRDNHGDMALHHALYQSKPRFKLIKSLINHGADINAQGFEGYTPLAYSVSNEISEYLLSKGANPNIPMNKGAVPLHNAAHFKQIPRIKMLLSYGADINFRDDEGRIPLHYSVLRKVWETARFLLKNGSNPNIKDKKGKTPLDYADEKNRKKLQAFIKSLKTETPASLR